MGDPYMYEEDEIKQEVVCPVCDCACEEIYKDINKEVVGCDCCISKIDSYEYYIETLECQQAEYDHFMELKYDEERMR